MDELFAPVMWSLVFLVCIFIVLDYVSGVVKGIVEKNLQSGVMWIGLFKKMGYFIALALAFLLESAAQLTQIPYDVPLFNAACVFIIVTETTSILENIGVINPELKTNKFLQIFGVKKEDVVFYDEEITELDEGENDA